MAGKAEARAGIWSRGAVVMASVVDSRLWRTSSETGDREPSSRTGRGGSVTTLRSIVSEECVSACDKCESERPISSCETRPL